VRGRQCLTQTDRFVELAHGVFVPTGTIEGQPHVVVRRGVIGRQAYSLFGLLLRLGPPLRRTIE
jgi:hypothetical protein